MIQTIISILPVAYVALIALPLVLVDMKEHRLPNKIVLPMIPLTLLTQLTLAIWTGAWASLGISVGMFFAVMVLGILANYYDWIGMGDVKLMAGLTMILSWFTVLGGALLMPMSIALGLLITVVTVLTNSKVRQIPLGPAILATFAAILTITLI
jgi:leader peptidase (prepilin peptidase)/N-methyltransferase